MQIKVQIANKIWLRHNCALQKKQWNVNRNDIQFMNGWHFKPVHKNDTLLLLIKLISEHTQAHNTFEWSEHNDHSNKQTDIVHTHTIQNESIPNVRHINKCELCLLGKCTHIHYTRIHRERERIMWNDCLYTRHIHFLLPIQPNPTHPNPFSSISHSLNCCCCFCSLHFSHTVSINQIILLFHKWWDCLTFNSCVKSIINSWHILISNLTNLTREIVVYMRCRDIIFTSSRCFVIFLMNGAEMSLTPSFLMNLQFNFKPPCFLVKFM